MSGTTYRGPINRNPKDDEAGIVIYGYIPSLALGIIGIIAFATVLCVHSFWLIRNKGTRSFHMLMIIGALMEVGGYAARLASHQRPFVVSSFVAQYFLIVVAPVLFSAAIYLSLSIATKGYKGSEKYLIISPKKVLIFFVTADVITTIIQIAGAALIGTSESARVRGRYTKVTPEQANNILIAGLAIQCFSFTCFLFILLSMIYRLRSHSSTNLTSNSSSSSSSSPGSTKLPRFLYTILITACLILLRTTFRLAESGQGFFGFASTHESLFGTLEFLPVILALIIWSIYPPSKFISNPNPIFNSNSDSQINDRDHRGDRVASGIETRQISRDVV
ncbi:uncharacterized protein IL334_004254 [Kwoniella shivajii]|uniref:RTA1-domain-containing protein n=1 Tax=Kwoniella shivajii TaxID=564305 RepID=A0ABZ1D3V5_9TREE|nr:hypothetical protein IL334_004254 [Kwoniella shivajii]